MRVSQAVLETLDRAQTDGSRLVLADQLDRKLYELTNKALLCAGGKWDRRAQAHVFDGDAAEAIEPILLTGEITDAKNEFQAFWTPLALAVQVIAHARIRPGMRVLEPSVGRGALALEAYVAGGDLTCVELDKSLAKHWPGAFHVTIADFLQTDMSQLGGPFDRVVMNPPFSKQQDARHVLHAARMLRPDGRLVSIMSAAALFRETPLYREVRDLVVNRGGSLTALPEGSFKASGTSVNTCLCIFDGAPK